MLIPCGKKYFPAIALVCIFCKIDGGGGTFWRGRGVGDMYVPRGREISPKGGLRSSDYVHGCRISSGLHQEISQTVCITTFSDLPSLSLINNLWCPSDMPALDGAIGIKKQSFCCWHKIAFWIRIFGKFKIRIVKYMKAQYLHCQVCYCL
jgi:hypothetical protein